ncbi:MAG: 5'-nucleotidase, lipoprotein e(P4) family [Pyrinomonadaceae bacterium]
MRSRTFLISFAFLLQITASFVTPANGQEATVPVQTSSDYEYQLGAVLYMQKAAEYRALTYQAFNLARRQLDEDLDKKNLKKLPKAERNRPRAVVVDVDETVLDNSGYQVLMIKDRKSFGSKEWYAYTDMRKSRAVPGAVDFVKYANSMGVKVFYISNRDETPQLQATIDNLRSVGFPNVSAENVLMRNKISAKEPRRQLIGQKYRIVLLIGDSLDDISETFEQKSIAERFTALEQIRNEIGRRFIMLPNAMYGTWEKAIYEYGRLTEQQKAQKRVEALELP